MYYFTLGRFIVYICYYIIDLNIYIYLDIYNIS